MPLIFKNRSRSALSLKSHNLKFIVRDQFLILQSTSLVKIPIFKVTVFFDIYKEKLGMKLVYFRFRELLEPNCVSKVDCD